MSATPSAPVRTFLIADIRGYTRFTEEHGDEASAKLTAKFASLVQAGVEIRSGNLIEIRGDEALAVFDSARQAIRAAVDLQRWFVEHSESDANLPLRVGIGVDSGEAVRLEDGSFRGAALNVAARLCALAQGGEVIVSEGTTRLAGRVPGVRTVDRGRANLKGIDGPVHLISVSSEEEQQQEQSQPWIVMFFGGSKGMGWRIALGVALIAAATAAAVVYLTTGGDSGGASSGGAPTSPATTAETTETVPEAPASDVKALIPVGLRKTCTTQQVPDIGAVSTAVCLPPSGGGGFYPDRWQVSIYPSKKAVLTAYDDQLRNAGIARNSGKCTSLSWGGEGSWQHGPGKPGGRRFCYFDGNDAVLVWVHERLGQPDHRDVLAIAREGGSDHVRLIGWWAFAHHLIGKVT